MRLFIVTFPFGGAKPVIANKKTVLRKSQSICRDELQALSMRLKVGNLFSAYACYCAVEFCHKHNRKCMPICQLQCLHKQSAIV